MNKPEITKRHKDIKFPVFLVLDATVPNERLTSYLLH